jgi:cyanate permease
LDRLLLGEQIYDAWNAFVMTVGYFFAAGGSLMAGAVRDLTGDFQFSFDPLVGTLAVTPQLKSHQKSSSNGIAH